MLDFDTDVRRFDEDRWLASRFALVDVRAQLIAIYALNNEIARTADAVTQPAIGDIRLSWWREAIEEVVSGKRARAHPIIDAFARAHQVAPQPLAVWERLIEGRGKDLDSYPFASWPDLENYVDATAGGVMRAALTACGVDPSGHERLLRAAAQSWGCVGLLRAEPHWRERGRRLLPRAGGSLDDIATRARAAIAEMASMVVPSRAFPALGYGALARGYLKAHERGVDAPPLLLRQMRLIAAAATGRL